MTRVTIVLFTIFSNFLFSQTEQKSLDFFAQEILPKLKKTKVFFDGKIIEKSIYENILKNEDEETIIENILWDYSLCKKDQSKFNFDFKQISKIANVQKSIATNISIPKNINYRKELTIKKRKAGKLRFKINKLFTQKYNLKVSPSIQIAENTFLTRIFMTKQNYEYGNNYDIIVKNEEVIDWCNSYWIQ
ncbi:hypothetical protein [Bergeyella sp. RCAD1439]|uniref:hypothetical protein n=1 Tax=Bergeyella anatis TaxID=3113737 RepID=UPI002E187CC4|nr:hypothetical protein [Bergeyella sp. RCAD1439]